MQGIYTQGPGRVSEGTDYQSWSAVKEIYLLTINVGKYARYLIWIQS